MHDPVVFRPGRDQCSFYPPQSGSNPQTADACGGSHAACNSFALSARSKNLLVRSFPNSRTAQRKRGLSEFVARSVTRLSTSFLCLGELIEVVDEIGKQEFLGQRLRKPRLQPNRAHQTPERCSAAASMGPARSSERRLDWPADAGACDEGIARSVGVGCPTAYRTKRRFVDGNLKRVLSEEPRHGAERKLMARKKPCWWQRTVPSPGKAVPAGRSSCWHSMVELTGAA